MGLPLDLAAAAVKGVDRVALGGHQHTIADHQWLGIDGSVELDRPRLAKSLRIGFIGEIAGASVIRVIG